MPEKYVLHISLRSPKAGYIFRCIPSGPNLLRYLPATKCVFPAWSGSEYDVTDVYRHGSIANGPLFMGQRPVAHHALKGEVVFELPTRSLEESGATVRLGGSLTFGRTAHYGKWDVSGVLKNDGNVVCPYSGMFYAGVVGNYVLDSFSYSEPFVHPVDWTLGEQGYKYSGLALTDKSVSYLLSNRNWLARQASTGAWTTASGYREEWSVTVTMDAWGFHGRAYTTLRETLVANKGVLIWTTARTLYDNWDLAHGKWNSVTSSAVEASHAPLREFEAAVSRAQSWASADWYGKERAQALNDALDSYRALHSNNIENAVQMQKISKLLPLDTARLVPHYRAELMAPRKALLMAKILSGLYLWWKYVVKTTYHDVGEILKSIGSIYPKDGPVTLRAKVSGERTYEFPNFTWVAVTCRVSPYNLGLLPLRLGVHPGLAQAWDLVPFSFVVDWFMGISNQLNAIDWFVYRSFLHLQYLLDARKTRVDVDASLFGGAGVAEVTVYTRVISLAWPGFTDSIPFPRGAPLKNWGTAAAALAIANVKLSR